ncbi:MAG: flagellar basal-body rod protein FlgG [Planctomycetes bacterium]|nr:flagellar basal-body rod protein FlgG [Planctomycetota bacterium]
MIRALYTAATGMKGQQFAVDVIANNLANVNTTAFKRSQVQFRDLLYSTLQAPGATSSSGQILPTGLQIGSGSEIAATSRVGLQGVPEITGRPYDIAVQGEGFFKVRTQSGELAYTRNGAFNLDAQGRLVTSEGFLLDPPITIPPTALNVQIAKDGTVSYNLAGQADSQTAGQILLTRFANTAGLRTEGSNLLYPTGASGQPQDSAPGTNGAGMLLQGTLERSNVEVASELVNLIIAQRSYEVNSRAIRSSDEMMQQVNNLAR